MGWQCSTLQRNLGQEMRNKLSWDGGISPTPSTTLCLLKASVSTSCFSDAAGWAWLGEQREDSSSRGFWWQRAAEDTRDLGLDSVS